MTNRTLVGSVTVERGRAGHLYGSPATSRHSPISANPSPTGIRAVRIHGHELVLNGTTLLAHAGESVEHPEGRIAPEEELYDLRTDSDERENLAGDLTSYDGPPAQSREAWLAAASDPHPDHAETLERLRADLLDWLAATDDPLADGCLPLSTRERARWRPDDGPDGTL